MALDSQASPLPRPASPLTSFLHSPLTILLSQTSLPSKPVPLSDWAGHGGPGDQAQLCLSSGYSCLALGPEEGRAWVS